MPALPPATLRMSGHDWLLLLALSVLWGGTFFLAKIALPAIPPVTLVLARVWLAALTLLFVLKASGGGRDEPAARHVSYSGLGDAAQRRLSR